MPRMNVKATEITDPAEMLERIAYRNKRIITRIDGHDDAAAFAKHLASRTRSDIRRLAELLGITLSND
jgi:ribosomal protein L32E